ncbi:MAG TPA: TonB-dependent receptor [Candidatus Angelobacter sp.]|nr:TonB-dependent receptor [Candidatus Angelobacter sp.]
MLKRLRSYAVFVFGLVVLLAPGMARAQGNSGSIEGVVKDPSGAGVANAKVEISYVVSGLHREVTTNPDGSFKFTNVPFNSYHTTVTAAGFSAAIQDVDVRSGVPVKVEFNLKISTEVTTVKVEANGGDLVENESTFHTDVDQAITDRLPLQSTTSGISSLVTLVTPGIAADSNGLFHGLGDHAQNSFSVDNQPVSDQQSKVFSNQLPTDSIQSLEVITGAPPAEFGDKTSIVIKVTTRSGLGVNQPTGRVYGTYGSFGTGNLGVNLAYGGQKWGNFIAANGLNTGRFLDGPEIAVLHDKGNQENVFDRVDYQVASADTIHMNFGFTRSWFQNPNTWDQQLHTCSAGFVCNAAGVALDPVPTGVPGPMGKTDQRSQIKTYNVAPTWTHLIGTKAVFTIGGFVRKDQFNFYPSKDPYADFSPALQAQTIGQDRKLTNAGLRADYSYVKGIHNIKAGITAQHWFLTENDTLATVDPGFSALFNQLDASGAPIPNPAGGNWNCGQPNQATEVGPCQTLATVDLTQVGGKPFLFHGHTDVKETSLYFQDTITKGSWSFNLGLRGDLYNGFVSDKQPEPRVGVSYNIKPSSTVLRLSYARTMETPFNENIVIANTGCSIPVIAVLVPPPNTPCISGLIHPGWRNEFHAGLEQAVGKYLVVDAEYIWKYTHNGFDFGVVAASPLAFPLDWHNSKIPGYAVRVSVPNLHGFTGLVVLSGVAARYFPPQVGGIPFLPAPGVFRIDHDEKFNQTTHLQYQPWKRGPWVAFNWRYDNGLVAGAVPCFAPTATCGFSTDTADNLVLMINNLTGLPLTADQEFQAGFTCNGVGATPTTPIPNLVILPSGASGCPTMQFGSKFIRIPAPGKENDDHNPQRIAPRNLFDASVGEDDLFHGDRFKWSLRFSAINLANKTALYNFFSTFSGTHYVTPRTETVELGFHF